MEEVMVFREYGSLEDAMEDMRKAEEAANERITDEQRTIVYGSYWARVVRYAMGDEIAIFGKVQTPEEIDESLRNVDPEEAEWERESRKASYERGYRFGLAYSVLEPDGEYGDTHLSVMKPITEEQFHHAKGLGWDLESLVMDGAVWLNGVPITFGG